MDTARKQLNAEYGLTGSEIDRLDPVAVEVFYEVDVDQLMVLFYRKDIVHASHPFDGQMGDFSLLIEIGSGRIAGVTSEPFSTRVVRNYPPLILFLGHATILDGIDVYQWSTLDESMSELVIGLRESFASVAAETDSRNLRDVRHLIKAFPFVGRDL